MLLIVLLLACTMKDIVQLKQPIPTFQKGDIIPKVIFNGWIHGIQNMILSFAKCATTIEIDQTKKTTLKNWIQLGFLFEYLGLQLFYTQYKYTIYSAIQIDAITLWNAKNSHLIYSDPFNEKIDDFNDDVRVSVYNRKQLIMVHDVTLKSLICKVFINSLSSIYSNFHPYAF